MGQVAGVALVREHHREGHHVLRQGQAVSHSQPGQVMGCNECSIQTNDHLRWPVGVLRAPGVLEVGHLGACPGPARARQLGLRLRVEHGLHPHRVLRVGLAQVNQREPAQQTCVSLAKNICQLPVFRVGPHVLDPEVVPLAVSAGVQVWPHSSMTQF